MRRWDSRYLWLVLLGSGQPEVPLEPVVIQTELLEETVKIPQLRHCVTMATAEFVGVMAARQQTAVKPYIFEP